MQQIYMPTKVIFGENTLDYLSNLKEDYKNIFVLSTRKGLSEENEKKIRDMLGDSIEIFSIGEIPSEPTEEDVNRLMQKKTAKTDCIIGIGGGSYLDAAKVLAIQEEKLADFNEASSDVLPIITVPTTAGTGAELTKAAIIRFGDIKKGVRSEKFFPKFAVVDPVLCDSMPLELTKYTAVDAFAHAVETFVSKKATDYTRSISEMSVKLIVEYLPKAIKEFKELGKPSLETRTKLSYASMLQGITLANASSALPHRIQYGVSTVSDASHPKVLACLLRAWLKMSQFTIAGYDYKQLIEFMGKVDLNIKLSNLGVRREDIDKIVDRTDGTLENDPIYKGKEQIREILDGSF